VNRHLPQIIELTERTQELAAHTQQLLTKLEASQGQRAWRDDLAACLAQMNEFGTSLRAGGIAFRALVSDVEAERKAYRELFRSAPNGYLVTDIDGRVIEGNQRAAALLGVEQGKLKGMLLLNFIRSSEREPFQCWLVSLAARPELRTLESRIESRDKALRWIEFSIGHARDSGGKLTSLRWILLDITSRKLAELELEQSRQQLRMLAARVQEVREEERKHIAREIHDQLGGDLSAMKLDVLWVAKRLGAADAVSAERLARIASLIDDAIDGVRSLASELRPAVLDLGLIPAIEWQLNEFKRRTGTTCHLSVNVAESDLASLDTTVVFRLFQEALTNVARHAGATDVEVAVGSENGSLRVEIRDNGRGITPEAIAEPTSLGLIGMRERAAQLAGRVDFEGTPGVGTRVVISIPSSGNA